MTRYMRRIACVTLVFYFFHPATAQSQSQKFQIWRVPVLPSGTGQHSVESGKGMPQPENGRAQRFQRFLSPSDDNQKSAHQLSTPEEAPSSQRGINETLASLGLLSLGGESGVWGGGRVSMRGYPGREPEVSLDGIPLSSGFSGAHSEELVPLVGIKEINAYPFLSGPGLPRRGLAGGYDLVLKSGSQKAQRDSLLSAEQPSALVFAHRQTLNCKNADTGFWGCVNIAWQSAVRRGSQDVLDDNNTPNNSIDDYDSKLTNNELNRSSVSIRTNNTSASGINFETTSLFGAENRGLNGLPVSQASAANRGSKYLSLVSHSGSSFSPQTGRVWKYRISGRSDSSSFTSDLKNQEKQLRKDRRRENVVGLGVGVSSPLHAGSLESRIFLNGNYDTNIFNSRYGLEVTNTNRTPSSNSDALPADSSLSGQLSSADLGAGIELSRMGRFLLRMESYIQWANSTQQQNCGAFAPQVLCVGQKETRAAFSPGAAIELQYNALPGAILYLLSGRSTRLPTPVELAGRPDGIASNLNLKAESSLFIESGMHTPFFHLGAYFANDIDLITVRQVSPFLVQYENTSQVRRTGAFGSGEVKFSMWEITAAHEQTWAHSMEAEQGQSVVPFVPSWQSRGSLKYRFAGEEEAKPWGNWSSAVAWSRTGTYGLDKEGIYKLSPPALISLAAEGIFSNVGGELILNFRIDNLPGWRSSLLGSRGGESREVPWSYLPALPIMGRAFVLSLRLLTP